MKGYITNNQIDYILYHLSLTFELNEEITRFFLFAKGKSPSSTQVTNKIIFNLSSEEFDINKVSWINEIPVLFPLSENKNFYSLSKGNLIFHHDLIKSCFYLLSGYQEFDSKNLDDYGRFKYKNSIQQRLGIIKKPIVNYYFKIIESAISDFLKFNDIKIKNKELFKPFAFFLTHDIDSVDYYTFNHLLYKIKEITGLVKTYYNFKTNLKHLLKTFFELLKFSGKENPAWNFEYLRSVEIQNNFRSSFYFLEKDKKHHDSNYCFSELRMKSLYDHLINENCEIGLHGTVGSVDNYNKLKKTLDSLNKVLPGNVFGVRQHRLLHRLPLTAIIQQKAGLKYDTSLSFAEHEGFRNSFCLPFKLYDFKNDRMINLWEIPLIAMDVTLFHYRQLSTDDALSAVKDLVNEIKKFNGVFTLLWHNTFFDEDRFPGIKKFYEGLLQYIHSERPQNKLGYEIINEC